MTLKEKEKEKAPPLEDIRSIKKSKLKDENAFTDTRMESDEVAGESSMQGQSPEYEDADVQSPILKQQKGPSFRDMLINNGNPSTEKEEEIVLDEADVAYYLKEGVPSISFLCKSSRAARFEHEICCGGEIAWAI